jgi:hypothetical protein
MSVDQMEYAKVHDAGGVFSEYVYGRYEEVEDYCSSVGVYVDRYLDHVPPHVVRAGFRYVGDRRFPPMDAALPHDYDDPDAVPIEKW